MKLNKKVTTRLPGTLLLGLLIIGGLTACNDNKEDNPPINTSPEYPTTPFSSIRLKEIKESDAQPVTFTQTYLYDSGRLTDYIGKQSFTAGDQNFEIENTGTVTYADRQAVVTDEIGTTSTYTLNEKGYATGCIRREIDGRQRTYTFDYLVNTEDKHYLTKITEKLNDEEKVFSSLTIDYSSFRALRITQEISGATHISNAIISPNHEIANISSIPDIFLIDQHPLSMHSVAIYGKLLGEPFNYLITQIIPDPNKESNETTTREYTLDKRGIVTSCKQVINSYGRNYVRTIAYAIE